MASVIVTLFNWLRSVSPITIGTAFGAAAHEFIWSVPAPSIFTQ